MALDSVDEVVAAATTAGRRQVITQNINPYQMTTARFIASHWRQQGTPYASADPPVSPGAIPTKSTEGSMRYNNATGGRSLYICGVAAYSNLITNLVIYDRLYHMSGLSGTVTTAQTVNNGTVPLTRYTNGEGNQIWLEWYAATGTTSVNVTASYTNQAGVSGRTTQSQAIGASGGVLYRFLPLLLQEGDTGVRSVESVTLSGSTGTAGNFGVTIVHELAKVIYFVSAGKDYSILEAGKIPIVENACLASYSVVSQSTTAGNISMAITTLED